MLDLDFDRSSGTEWQIRDKTGPEPGTGAPRSALTLSAALCSRSHPGSHVQSPPEIPAPSWQVSQLFKGQGLTELNHSQHGLWWKQRQGLCHRPVRGTPSWGACPVSGLCGTFLSHRPVYLFVLIKQDSLASGWEQAKCIVLLAFLGWVWTCGPGWEWEVGRGNAWELALSLSPPCPSPRFLVW